MEGTNILLLAGPIAFVLTAANVAVGLRFYFQIILLGRVPGKALIVVFMATSVVANIAWIIHLWPLNNLYVIVALMLELFATLLLLVQAIAIRTKT